MKLKIKAADIIKFVLFYSIVTNFLVLTFGLSSMFLYLNDLLIISLIVLIINYLGNCTGRATVAIPRPVMFIVAILLVVVLIAYVINLYSPLLFAWGLRNNFRAIVFFFACSIFLEKKDVNLICNVLLALLPLNVLLCTVQYIRAMNSTNVRVFNYAGDYVGGIFGNQLSCNRMLNVYIAFVFAWIFAQLLQKKCSRKRAAWVFICCAYISLLSELKIVIVEFAAIMALLIWLIRRKLNRFLMMVLCVLAVISVISILQAINPSSMGIFTDIEALIDYGSATSYGADSLNRLTVLPYIQERFFNGDVVRTLFGVGIGNADYSNFAFLTSSNYLHYGYLKYHYFMSGYLYFEIGVLGLVTYLLIFVALFIHYARKMSRNKDANPLIYAGVAFNVIALLCVFYNTSLRSEVSCYMAFFFLAIPIIWDNRSSEPDDSHLQGKRRRLVVRW